MKQSSDIVHRYGAPIETDDQKRRQRKTSCDERIALRDSLAMCIAGQRIHQGSGRIGRVPSSHLRGTRRPSSCSRICPLFPLDPAYILLPLPVESCLTVGNLPPRSSSSSLSLPFPYLDRARRKLRGSQPININDISIHRNNVANYWRPYYHDRLSLSVSLPRLSLLYFVNSPGRDR